MPQIGPSLTIIILTTLELSFGHNIFIIQAQIIFNMWSIRNRFATFMCISYTVLYVCVCAKQLNFLILKVNEYLHLFSRSLYR